MSQVNKIKEVINLTSFYFAFITIIVEYLTKSVILKI